MSTDGPNHFYEMHIYAFAAQLCFNLIHNSGLNSKIKSWVKNYKDKIRLDLYYVQFGMFLFYT